jgi:hypothetical protein
MNRSNRHDIPADLPANERWLSSFDSPPPSAQTSIRIKSAVRAELARRTAVRTVRLPRHDSAAARLLAALAVAAMLALTVGLIRLALPPSAPGSAETLELFADSLESVMDRQDPQLAELRDDLGEYEAQLAADLALPGDYGQSDTTNLLEELNGLLDDHNGTFKG